MEELYKFVEKKYSISHFENYCNFDYETILKKKDSNIFELLPVSKHDTWIFKNRIDNTEESDFVKNYNNIFCSLCLHRITILVTKKEDKVSIKLYEYYNFRNVGKKYFKKRTTFHYLTYNLKTNSVYSGRIIDYHKKKNLGQTIKKNNFYNKPIDYILFEMDKILKDIYSDTPNKLIHKTEIIDNILKIFFKEIPNSDKYKDYEHNKRLYGIFSEKRKIKTPNNWDSFVFHYPQPKIKDLKKHNMKYIDCFMEIMKLKGDRIKKILHHINNQPHFHLYFWAIKFFGESFLLNQNDNFLKKLITSPAYPNFEYNFESFSKIEKKNIFKILERTLDGFIDYNTFFDHLEMKYKLSKYEKVKWQSKTQEEFVHEHMNYSDRLAFYTKGTYKRYYNDNFKSLIESDINNEYYPQLLDNSTDYNMESFIQSNCVKNYISIPSSIIISVRKHDINSNERATVEYEVEKRDGELTIQRVQNLGKYNFNLSEDWNKILNILDLRIKEVVDKKIFDGTYICEYKLANEKKITNVIFGKEFTNSFSLEGSVKVENLQWEDKNFDKNYTNEEVF